VLAGLISELDSATDEGVFYDHVCEALCRLTEMRRAGLLLYEPSTRAVRAVGSHGVDRTLLGQVEATLDETPIARRALSEDRVIEASGDLERHIPPRYSGFAGISTIACGPVAAAGRWLGVIIADRGGPSFESSAQDRQTMLMLGRLAALAASVERATRQDERSRRLGERIELTREIHERVMQRLFALTLAFGSGQELGEDDLRTCHDELQSVLGELRSALGRPIAEHPRVPGSTLADLVARRAERTPELSVRWPGSVRVPEHLEQLAQSVLLEALRNCDKHADPERIEIVVSEAGDAFELEVINDGSGEAGGARGLGLRLLTLEALQQDALVEFGALPERRWHVRMVGPAVAA
jgi:signal transduction histidine kinase